MYKIGQIISGEIVFANNPLLPFDNAEVTQVSTDGSQVEEIQLLEDLPNTDLKKNSKVAIYKDDRPDHITNVTAINVTAIIK